MISIVVLFCGCAQKQPKHFTHEVLNRMTPIKNQGKSQTCWIYAMLAAIETEQLYRGDSVNLSPYYIEKKMEQEPECPEAKRGMGKTLLNLIKKYGIVGYDDMRTVEISDEYIALTSNDDEPYYQDIDIDLPDNWMHDRFYNIPIDSLLAKTIRAVRQHHGVCD